MVHSPHNRVSSILIPFLMLLAGISPSETIRAQVNKQPPPSSESKHAVLIAEFLEAADDRANKQDELEACLAAMVRIGASEFEPVIAGVLRDYKQKVEQICRQSGIPMEDKFKAIDYDNEDGSQSDDELDTERNKEWDAKAKIESYSRTLSLWTALRRLQKRPDPVHVFADQAIFEHSYEWPDLPSHLVTVRNIDTSQQEVGYMFGQWLGNTTNTGNRTPNVSFQYRVYNADSRKPQPFAESDGSPGFVIRSGPPSIFRRPTLRFGDGWTTRLNMEDYLAALRPGKYTFKVLYHNSRIINNTENLDDLICCESREYELSIRPRDIWLTEEEESKLSSLVASLDSSQPVRILATPYGPWIHKTIPPESELGQILSAGWEAVPALLKRLKEPNLPRQLKSHLLATLFNITGQVDPRGQAVDGSASMNLSEGTIWKVEAKKSGIGPFEYWRKDFDVERFHQSEKELEVESTLEDFVQGRLNKYGYVVTLDSKLQAMLIDEWKKCQAYIQVQRDDGLFGGGGQNGGGFGGGGGGGGGFF